jgi:hypothetical protein
MLLVVVTWRVCTTAVGEYATGNFIAFNDLDALTRNEKRDERAQYRFTDSVTETADHGHTPGRRLAAPRLDVREIL